MAVVLTEKQVADIMDQMTEEQQLFIEEQIKQSKKSKWLETLARKKGIIVSDQDTLEDLEEKLDDWILEEILDCGFGRRDSRCECRNPLRYQYIVRHTGRNQIYKLGETCFENYTGLSPHIIKI